MGEDLLVGDIVVDGLVFLIYEDRWLCHDIAARAAGVYLLDGVADRAGHTIFIELAIDWGAFCQRSRK